MTAILIIHKVRKGDVVAVETRHSYTTQKPFRTVSYSRFHIGRVVKATRQGLATIVALPNGQNVETGKRCGDVIAIKDDTRQFQAACLFAATSRDFGGYESEHALRDAILSQPES
ncbi:hypothetical protein [Rhodopseudomonas palustris]|uniref:hypothetical protein n=1 Tax=Rhodopseudomonas palustris TaxID=1076 RepID=UPI000641C5EB|nr:hypothetical protein [Rhodopseudomonas palustris]